MSFVDEHQVPTDGSDFGGLGTGKLIRTKYESVYLLERVDASILEELVEVLRFEDDRVNEELLPHFAVPLLAETRRQNAEYPPPPFGPKLADYESGFDCLPKPDFVGEDRSPR